MTKKHKSLHPNSEASWGEGVCNPEEKRNKSLHPEASCGQVVVRIRPMNERETAAGDLTCADVSPDDLSSVQVGPAQSEVEGWGLRSNIRIRGW